MYPIIRFLGQDFGTYGICIVVGALFAFLVLWLLTRQKEEYQDAIFMGLFAMAFGIVGSFAFKPIINFVNLIVHWDTMQAMPLNVAVQYLFGEIVFYGGFLGGVVGILLYKKWFKVKVRNLINVAAVVMPLAHAFGRVGCFFGGCCYGMQVSHNHPLAVVFPKHSFAGGGAVPAGVPLLNVQLLEAGFLLLLFGVNLLLFLKFKNKSRSAEVYLIAYSVWRFVIEFFRGDQVRGIYGGISTSQYISVGLFAAGVLMIVFDFVKKRREKRKETENV